MRLPPTLAVLTAAASLAGACGDDSSGAEGACGPIRREALDPAFLVHVVGDEDGADVTYRSDPPTSGPHQPTPAVEGALDAPLSRPVQVGILEQGDVLLQHGPEVTGGNLDALRALAGEGVVVAPNPDLPAPVVATAWVAKRTCDGVDVDALEEFVADRRGKGPGDQDGAGHR